MTLILFTAQLKFFIQKKTDRKTYNQTNYYPRNTIKHVEKICKASRGGGSGGMGEMGRRKEEQMKDRAKEAWGWADRQRVGGGGLPLVWRGGVIVISCNCVHC